MAQKKQKTTTSRFRNRHFASIAERRKWLAAKSGAMIESDRPYYLPLVAPTEEGKEAYLKAMKRIGCGKEGQPSDVDIFSVLFDVPLPVGLDKKVLLHCDQCLPCFLWMVRAANYGLADLPGSGWSEEVGKRFPLKVKGWENPLWHFRMFYASVVNGPSFRVHALPFDKGDIPVIAGSCAGIFGKDDNCPLKELVESSHKQLKAQAKPHNNFSPHLDAILIVQFARGLSFDIDNEIYDFLKV